MYVDDGRCSMWKCLMEGCMRNFPHLWGCMKKKYDVDSNQLKFMDGP
jgi:hypothetical protein